MTTLGTADDLDLTHAEWETIFEVMHGHLFVTDRTGRSLLSAEAEILPNVEDGDLGPAGERLATKLRQFSPDQWAIVRAVVEDSRKRGG